MAPVCAAANGEILAGDRVDLLVFQFGAARRFIDADQIAELERAARADELEHAGRGDADVVCVAAAGLLHGDAEEVVVECLLVEDFAPLIGQVGCGLRVVGVEINEVADLDHGRVIDGHQDGVRVAVAPAEEIGHGWAFRVGNRLW